MEFGAMEQAVTWIEKSNADLDPELLTRAQARALLDTYTRARRLVDFGIAQLSRKLDDAGEIARATGTSMGRARETLNTGKVLRESGELSSALKGGEISLDQACEIAKAEGTAPGSAEELVDVAKNSSFNVLKEQSLKRKLDAERHKDLGGRQKAARCAQSHTDALGMIHIDLSFEPHVGTPIVNRAEAVADRLRRAARREGHPEPFERHLADAYAAMLSGNGKGPARRAELVVLVSHEVAKRGWSDVKDGETCKIPGVGPVPPQVAKEIGQDAFLTGVFYDGKDLRHMRRWTRSTPVEVRLALQLGEPPEFDGIKCVDCGNRLGTQDDHVEPHVARGPASTDNLDPRCWECHKAKTARDRKAGKLKPPDP